MKKEQKFCQCGRNLQFDDMGENLCPCGLLTAKDSIGIYTVSPEIFYDPAPGEKREHEIQGGPWTRIIHR